MSPRVASVIPTCLCHKPALLYPPLSFPEDTVLSFSRRMPLLIAFSLVAVQLSAQQSSTKPLAPATTKTAAHPQSAPRAPQPASLPQLDPSLLQSLHWRSIGPFRGGRTRAVSGVASQPNVFYIGVCNGGVWKTNDYGRTWQPIFDDRPTGSIGAIAVA